MYLDQTHILNKKVLEYLSTGEKRNNFPPIAAPESVINPYTKQGSHPEIVERVWDTIGASLPEDCRCLVYGTPALVHPNTGILIAFGNGTTYCIRLKQGFVEKALKAGAKQHQTWTYGGEMDTFRDLGPDWLFGCWLKDEMNWCNEVYKELTTLGSD